MNDEAILGMIIGILRQDTFSGSGRPISPVDPLGESGLGLDSLAMVEFITALEKRFRISFPNEIWVDRDQMTLHKLAAFISSVPRMPSAMETMAPGRDERGRGRQFVSRIRGQGFSKSLAWVIHYRLMKRQTFYLLEFDLQGREIPSFSASLDLELRAAYPDDAEALAKFWSSLSYRTADSNEPMDGGLFRRRLAAGLICLAAWHKGDAVGIDWIRPGGFACPFTGLTFDLPEGTCFAMELYEHSALKGKGIGMALLVHSLNEAKKRHYLRQVTMVHAANLKMLAAAVQLFGFKKIGKIDTDRLFRRPISKWEIGRKSGRARKLTLAHFQ